MASEKKGYIYVLTNESFHRENWIKIGYAEDVEKRVKELSNTSIPLPYEVYCTYEIPRIQGVKDPDKSVHDLIQALNPNLRISPNREFFEIAPWDAYNMLEAVARMHGRTDKLVINEKNKSVEEENIDNEYSVEAVFPPGSIVEELYKKIRKIIMSMDKNIVEAPRLHKIVYKYDPKHNIVSLWPHSGWIEVILNAKQGTLNDRYEITYDISNRRWPNAQYAFRFYDNTDVEAVKDLIQQAWEKRKR